MFGWFGEVGGTRKNHTRRCLWSLNYLAERQVRKTTKFIFEFLTLLFFHRFFFFVPATLNPIFLGKSKKTRAGKWSRSVFSKNNLEPYDAIWCQFGSQFSSPKTRVYEYNQLIFSISTVFFFWNSRNLDNFTKIVIFDKLASFFLDPHPHSDSHPCIGP